MARTDGISLIYEIEIIEAGFECSLVGGNVRPGGAKTVLLDVID
jgi:hypothetical protein